MFLAIVFLMLAIGLSVIFFAGGVAVQSYVFTEVTPGLSWRASTAAMVMAVFFTFWSFLATRSETAPRDLFRFSLSSELLPKPAPQLWAIRGDGKVVRYSHKEEYDGINKKDLYVNGRDPYRPGGVVALEIEEAPGQKMRFEVVPAEQGGYRSFRSDRGWTIQEFDNGPTGRPVKVVWGQLLGNLLMNFLHAGLWFVCLWLILRFTIGTAMLFGAILWALMTVAVLPVLLDQAALNRPITAFGIFLVAGLRPRRSPTIHRLDL